MKIFRTEHCDGFDIHYWNYTPGKTTLEQATVLLSQTETDLPNGDVRITMQWTTPKLAQKIENDKDPRKRKTETRHKINPTRDERILNLRNWELEQLDHKFTGNWIYVGRGNRDKQMKRSPLANPFKQTKNAKP